MNPLKLTIGLLLIAGSASAQTTNSGIGEWEMKILRDCTGTWGFYPDYSMAGGQTNTNAAGITGVYDLTNLQPLNIVIYSDLTNHFAVVPLHWERATNTLISSEWRNVFGEDENLYIYSVVSNLVADVPWKGTNHPVVLESIPIYKYRQTVTTTMVPTNTYSDPEIIK